MKAARHHKIWIVITIALAILAYVLVNGCTTVIERPLELRPGDTACDTTDHTSSSSAGSSDSGSTESSFTCPTIVDGDVGFCLPDLDCRAVYFEGVADASEDSTLAIYWPGTYEWQVEPPTAAAPWNFMNWAAAVDALVAVPRPDPAAVARTNNPFPWWVVCGQTNPSGCDRDDDFALAEAVAQCAVEQGLASPQRLTSAGMSAGAIMTSFLVERGLGDLELAAAVSWSGGQPAAAQPTVPASAGTAVFALHGGTTDIYCGIGNLPGTCGGYTPYAFEPPSGCARERRRCRGQLRSDLQPPQRPQRRHADPGRGVHLQRGTRRPPLGRLHGLRRWRQRQRLAGHDLQRMDASQQRLRRAMTHHNTNEK